MRIIADTCCNHEGKWENIQKMIHQLAELKIDYVKFQVFTANKLNKDYPDYDKWYAQYSKYELKSHTISKIIDECIMQQIKPLFTLFDVDKADMLYSFGMKTVKIASPDCNNWVLLDKCFKMFDTVIISTGMHTDMEIELMLETYKKYRDKIVLLYCKSQYPAIYTNTDLNKALRTLRFADEYKTDFGISDHGHFPNLKNVDYYEHHFTLEHTGKADDAVSWTIQDFAKFLGIGDEYEARLKYRTRWVV